MGEDGARKRRRTMIAIGVAGLLVGLAVGAAGGGETKTVTETDTLVRTETVPVTHVRTVTRVRRVVHTRTRTITVQAEPSGGGYGGGGGGSDYAGLNCSEIGHSFTVTPGSDPEHDADNDGIACESY
ncbi:MAG TPA: hypothetical protein VE972_13470 [Conexibacter sp.]|nr:hypothetical protein [Conexibacter sp.]